MDEVLATIDGIDVTRDPSTGRWTLRGFGACHVVRPWTWGERRRLTQDAWRGGVFDRAAFVRALLALLMEPAPEPSLEPLWATAALGALGAAGAPADLTGAELTLARELGWGPRELDGQPAAEVDRLLARLTAVARRPTPPDDGWRRIVVVDDD